MLQTFLPLFFMTFGICLFIVLMQFLWKYIDDMVGKGIGIAVLAEIYAARETNDIGISSSQLAAEIPGAIYCSTLDQVADTLAQMAQPGDLILTVGAGDIFRAGEKLLAKEN